MKITVDRISSDDDTTISIVNVDGVFQCFGLEDEYRENKVASETRIPAGTYQVGVRDVGGFHNRYSGKFPDFHRGMLQVMGVPGFEYVLIHIGNTDEDTAGCLLVGAGCFSEQGNMSIQSSTSAYRRLYKAVIDAAMRGELEIEYIDSDI